MSPCPDRESLLQALLDGELDAANVLEMEAHLRTCQGCAAHFRLLQALKTRLAEADLAVPAPPRLRARIESMIEAETWPAHASPRRGVGVAPAAGWSAVGAMAALAASFLLFVAGPLQSGGLQDQLVASHVRSLLASHLIDVATSDRHVVKPWFNGKIDFAPPVVDLANQGFPLVGGRLDYADKRVVAALVYRRNAHIINLFVMPARAQTFAWPIRHAPTSYAVVHWTRGGLEFWAVSDLEARELEAFHQDFAARAPS